MHETLIHRSIAQRYYKNLQYKIEEKDKTFYWASIHKKREVSRKVSFKPCKWGDVARGCPDMWVEWEPGMHNFICGCLCWRRAVPVMDANFSKPVLAFILFFICFFPLPFLFIQGLTRGHCLGMVTRADSVTHKYFHRDEKVGSWWDPLSLRHATNGHCLGVVTRWWQCHTVRYPWT